MFGLGAEKERLTHSFNWSDRGTNGMFPGGSLGAEAGELEGGSPPLTILTMLLHGGGVSIWVRTKSTVNI